MRPRTQAILTLLCALPLPAAAATVYGLSGSNILVRFESTSPFNYDTVVTITGLQPAETVLGIDFRTNGELFALGSTNRLYRVDRQTGAATQIGSPDYSLLGTAFGFDFIPTVDRIRVVSDADANLRINPNSGLLTAADTSLGYAMDDPHFGQSPTLVAIAYTNNYAGASSTAVFGIDAGFDTLVLLSGIPPNPSPNQGVLLTIGPLGVDVGAQAGLEIFSGGATNEAFATLNTNLYSINLTTGAATLISATNIAAPAHALAIPPVRIFRNGYE